MALEVEPLLVDRKISPNLRQAASIFGGLSDDQLDKLLSYISNKIYSSGDKLFIQGDLPTEIYLVCTGRIDLVVERGGVFNIEASYTVGDTIGETSLIGIQPQVGTAIVSGGNAELLVISRKALLDLYESDVQLYALLMMNIAREVSRKLHCLIKAV